MVRSPPAHNEMMSLASVYPITLNTQLYPFKVMLPEDLPIDGAVLANRAKSIDRVARQLRVTGPAPRSVLLEVQAKIAALLGIDDG